jgi:SAM-dependent methyltransferase
MSGSSKFIKYPTKINVDPLSEPFFCKIADKISAFLNPLSKNIDEENIILLRKAFSSFERMDLNYDGIAIEFAYEYFLRNFWKYLLVLSNLILPIPTRIVDAGCGSGALTIAYLAFLERIIARNTWSCEITLIDKSKKQLELAKEMLDLVHDEFSHLTVVPNFVCENLENWKSDRHNIDLLLFGHVLNENQLELPVILDNAFDSAAFYGKILMVERPDDSIWNEVHAVSAKRAFPVRFGITSNNSMENSDRRNTPMNLSSRYAVIDIPEKKQLVKLLSSYFIAWENQSLGLLRNIFSTSARYFDKPFSPPLTGITQIEEYWRENVINQRNVNTLIKKVAYYSDNAFAEWEAEFNQGGLNVHLKGQMIMTLDEQQNRISQLHEYYESKNP